MAIEIFISYSHKDRRLREELDAHLAQLKNERIIRAWHDGQITAGQQWELAISSHLARADIILLMISARFLESYYCYEKELAQAIARHEAGQARVIPVIIRPCDWQTAPFSGLQVLPKGMKPIASWNKRDAGWTDVVRGIRSAIKELNSELLKKVDTNGNGVTSNKVAYAVDSSEWIFEMTQIGEIIPYKPPIEWDDGEDGLLYYAKLGFKSGVVGHIGNEYTDHLTWHERSDGEGHKYLVEWSDVHSSRLILVPDWPTLVKLQALAAPIIQAVIIGYHLSELQELAEKTFRVWHGHDATGICTRCDPDEMKRIREARAKRARSNSDEGS